MNPEETLNRSAYDLVEPATPSFYNDPDGDVILRASDAKNFQVSKTILKLASPVFRTMFSLPQPPTSPESDSCNVVPLPEIQVNESGAALDLLLRLIYPVERPDLASDTNTMATIVEVLCAVKKYEIDFIFSPVGEAFKTRVETSKEEAVAGFTLAANRKLHMQAQVAATACLRWPLRDIINIIPEPDLTSGTDFVNLLKYHERASQVVTDLFASYNFLTGPCSFGNDPCYSCRKSHVQVIGRAKANPLVMYAWWDEWSKYLIAALREAPLGVEAISLSTLYPHFTNMHTCGSCRNDTIGKWETGKSRMIDAIKTEVDKIEFKFGYM